MTTVKQELAEITNRQENERALYWFRRAFQANPNDRDARRFIERLTEDVEGDDKLLS